jgi:hydroxymethylpyrimidine/phosphomethylpyrimidine kinase
MQIALSIAGSDPTGGAGLQADVQVFRAHGLHGAGVATALTIQDSAKVHRVLPVFPSLVLEQLRTLLSDLQPAAVKIGMLATDDVVRNVTWGLEALDRSVPIIIDPVLAASDGTPLLEARALPSLKSLFEGCRLVTPNLPEAEALTGLDVSSRAGCEAAARHLIEELGARGVLLKGGHREGAPDDLLATAPPDASAAIEFEWLPGERIDAGTVHGTGCALSAAIASNLALGHGLQKAVSAARRFVADAIARAEAPGAASRFLVFSSAAQ